MKSCVPLVVAGVVLASLALLSALAAIGQWHPREAPSLKPWRDIFETVASSSTIEAMEQDELLLRRYVEMVQLTTDLSKKVAARYQVPDLIRASEFLDAYGERLRSAQLPRATATRPGLIKRLFGFGDPPATNSSSGTATDSGLAGLFAPLANAFSSIGDGIMKDLTGSAMFFGIGLGSGAAQGLKLATPNMTQAVGAKIAADNGQQATGLNPAIENFGLGLSGSLLGSLNLSSLAGGAGAIGLGPLMRSLAEGLGNGTVSGLKLSAVDVEPPNGSTIPDAAGNFGYGLSKSLASNINVTAVVGAMPPMDFGRVAQGFARGLVQGAGDAVTSIGGVSALMNGTAHAPKVPLPNSTLAFNDSVGGAATGFGEGLGGQAVLVGQQLLSGFKIVTPAAASKRGLLDPRAVTVRRQSSPSVVMVNGTSGFNLSVLINADTVSTAAQLGVNALTCQGVGGLMGVVLGLVNSGTIPTDQLSNNANASDLVRQIVPTGIIRITNAGNTYDIDGQQVLGGKGSLAAAAGGVSINGHSAMTFIWFLLLHSKHLDWHIPATYPGTSSTDSSLLYYSHPGHHCFPECPSSGYRAREHAERPRETQFRPCPSERISVGQYSLVHTYSPDAHPRSCLWGLGRWECRPFQDGARGEWRNPGKAV